MKGDLIMKKIRINIVILLLEGLIFLISSLLVHWTNNYLLSLIVIIVGFILVEKFRKYLNKL